MGKVIEINVVTNEITEYEIEDVVTEESDLQMPLPFLVTDPVEKLRSFLLSNPDVAQLLKVEQS